MWHYAAESGSVEMVQELRRHGDIRAALSLKDRVSCHKIEESIVTVISKSWTNVLARRDSIV